MGVNGLLPKLENIKRAVHVRDISGCKVGVEASSWLYKVVYACSWEVYTNQVTDRYVTLFEEAVTLLLKNNVQPVIVFDGEQIAAKAKTKKKRDKKRQQAKQKADAAMQDNDLQTAKRAAAQAIQITDDIVESVMKALCKLGVPYLKAPYEADAQLAYMAQMGVIDYVITEDSDLLVYGAPKVIYKWDRRGGVGVLVEAADLWEIMSFAYSRDAFIALAVLSGCDYLASLPRIGILRAERFLAAIPGKSILQEVNNIGNYVGINVDVPPTYKDELRKAAYVYKHQMVYDFPSNSCRPCNPYQPHSKDYGDYAGNLACTVSYTYQLEKVWLTPQELDISGISDISWAPSNGDSSDNGEDNADTTPQYQTRQGGQAITINEVDDVVEWTVPGLPVLTLPLLLGKDDLNRPTAVYVTGSDEQDDLPAVGPFTLFCRSSCYISYQEEQYFLIWEWESIGELEEEGDEEEAQATSTSDEWGRSSEGEGDDVVVLGDEDTPTAMPTGTHVSGFKVMGQALYDRRQKMLRQARELMRQGHEVATILRQEPKNTKDPNAIQVVIAVGDEIECVGYIPRELTQYVNGAINDKLVVKVKIQHIVDRAFTPPGLYMRLLITKKGRWDHYVIRKSFSAK